MLILISPAKRLDWSMRGPATSEPEFRNEAAELAGLGRALSVEQLRRLMALSDPLARQARDRFRQFATSGPDRRPAALAFAGDTYAGLEAASLEADELRFAQDRLRILSGLYGLLRPLDAISAYRLEMGCRLENPRGPTLYDYWRPLLAPALNRQAAALGTRVLINCASVEYFKAVDTRNLAAEVITPVFLEDRPGGPKTISFFAKKARGAMARFIIERRLTAPEGILDFDTGGYRHVPGLGTPERPVFLRTADAARAA